MKISKLAIIAGVMGFVFAPSANALMFTLEEFTGADAKVDVTVQNMTGGISMSFVVDGAVNLGDLTGLWLDSGTTTPGSVLITNTVFSPASAGPVTWEVIYDPSLNLGGGINLTGGSGAASIFDFDLALKQIDSGQNAIVSQVGFTVANLVETDIVGLGARLQSVGPDGELSSKLLVSSVPEPAQLGLLGIGLVAVGFAASWRRKI